ncbi:hypothetical protein [Endozoicomonas arenosclerae]|uniref:hypothetical protein n=1 Tax=Endozoicomonas arenosclerae TaxID=1633495 RepID=UPI000A9436FF
MSLGNDQRVEMTDWKAIIEGYCFLIPVYPLFFMEVAKWAVGCLIHGLYFASHDDDVMISGSAIRQPMPIRIPQTINTSTILLLIEGFLLGQLDHPLASTLLTSVKRPIGNLRISRCSPDA